MVCGYFPTRFYLKSSVALYITIITIIKTDGHPTCTRNLFLPQEEHSSCPGLFMQFRELTSEFPVWQNAETPIVPPRGTYSYLTDFENVKLLASSASGYKNYSCSIALSDSVTSSAPWRGGPVRAHDTKLQNTVIVGCNTLACFCTNSPQFSAQYPLQK
jgi:hypothetical protein